MSRIAPTFEDKRRARLNSFRATVLQHAVLMLKEREDRLVSADFDKIFTTAFELKQHAKELGISDANVRSLLNKAIQDLALNT